MASGQERQSLLSLSNVTLSALSFFLANTQDSNTSVTYDFFPIRADINPQELPSFPKRTSEISEKYISLFISLSK